MEDYLSTLKTTGLARWNQQDMPIQVYIEPVTKAACFQPQFVDIVKSAWLEWIEAASSAKISCRFVENPSQANVTCTWMDNKRDLATNLGGGTCTSAETLLSLSSGTVKHATIRILTVPPLNIFHRVIPDNVMYKIALHEIGHALGLIGHSEDSMDVMYGFAELKDERWSLSTRDVNTILNLYALGKVDFEKHKYDSTRFASNSPDPKYKAMQLNNEAFAALQARDFQLAINRLEEARKLDPNNKLIQQNLGIAYCGCGTRDLLTLDFSLASLYFTKGVSLLSISSRKRSQ